MGKKTFKIFSFIFITIGLILTQGEPIRAERKNFTLDNQWITNNQWIKIGGKSFEQVNTDGFGSSHNSYAWSMAWFKGKLYVGTNRDFFCYLAMVAGTPYPPDNPDLDCPQDPDFRAEIWSFDPQTSTWSLVYQSPHVFLEDQMVALDMGYRGMTVVRESDGKEALYIGGYLSRDAVRYFPARLLRTTDGENFQEVKSSDPTVLGNCNIVNFRSLFQYKDKLYATAHLIPPQTPILIELDLAAHNSGNDEVTMNVRQINPSTIGPVEIAVFNDYLYVGTYDPINGFSVLKTEAKGDLPYTFTPVVTNGAWRVDRDGKEAGNLNQYALSMCAFKDYLYVGTGCGMGGYDFFNQVGPATAEIIRIKSNDTWQLVCGKNRNTPDGYKFPISLMPAGFADPFTGYFWKMEVHDDWLYVSTGDNSLAVGNFEMINKLSDDLKGLVDKYGDTITNIFGGFDLWKTRNGIQWYPVTTRGFGEKFNIGGRTMESTPYGLFIGTANPFKGCEVWLGEGQFVSANDLQAVPDGELIELSWLPPTGTATTHIYRKELVGEGLKLQEFEEIAETQEIYYIDTQVEPGKAYMYMVTCENGAGESSSESNVVTCWLPRYRLLMDRILPGTGSTSTRFPGTRSSGTRSSRYWPVLNLFNTNNYDAISSPLYSILKGFPFTGSWWSEQE